MARNRKHNEATLQAECDSFNKACPVGSPVNILLDGATEPKATTVKYGAEVMCGSAVAWVHGVSGCYLLERITAATPSLEGGKP